MSLNRTALRLATVLLLTNNNTAPYPTLAGARVYDSRIDEIQGENPEDLVPTIIVYTDADTGDGVSANNGGPNYTRTVNLVLDIMLGQVADDPELGLTFVPPDTDPKTEAMLDLMEYQVRFAFANIQSPLLSVWSKTALRIEEWSSDRFVLSEGQIPLSWRRVTAQVAIPDDDIPAVVTAAPGEAPVPANIQAILDAVADTPTSYAKATIELLQDAGIPHTITLDALKDIYMTELTPTATQTENSGVTFTAEDLDQ